MGHRDQPHGPSQPDEPAREAVTRKRPPGVPPHQPDVDPATRDPVDEASEESFPTSDPPSSGQVD